VSAIICSRSSAFFFAGLSIAIQRTLPRRSLEMTGFILSPPGRRDEASATPSRRERVAAKTRAARTAPDSAARSSRRTGEAVSLRFRRESAGRAGRIDVVPDLLHPGR
jgi:hypothetical protein